MINRHYLTQFRLFAVAFFVALFFIALLVFVSSASVRDVKNHSTNKNISTKSISTNKSTHAAKYVKHRQYLTHGQTPVKPAYSVQKVGFSLGLISQQNAFDMLNNMSDTQLTGYLKNMVPDAQSLALINQRAFAKRALMELYQSNAQRTQYQYQKPNTAWQGKLVLGSDASFPAQPMPTHKVKAYQKIFVHLHTPNTSLHKGRLFISWIHKDTGSVKIFNMKYINAHSNKNWVSLKPNDGWDTGTYEVVFYQFDDALTPLGQISYDIHKVTGKKIFSYGGDDFYEDEEHENDNSDDEIDDLDPADYALSEEELKIL